jgi:electron transfer flavoprotein alpha subunit
MSYSAVAQWRQNTTKIVLEGTMGGIVIHHEMLQGDPQELIGLCPFGALCCTPEGRLEITAGCKMCKLCIRKGPAGVFEYREDVLWFEDKDAWRGVAVYVDHFEGQIHPVTFELLGKARELADKCGQPVYALFAGSGVENRAEELLHYGVDEVFVYDSPALEYFRVEPYTAAFTDFVRKVKPGTVLVGGTTVGRSLAPRTAARLRTGLTADCTTLDMQPSGELDQIRPAFGGNIMAHIRTPYHRPQFATVRYKIFSAPARQAQANGAITRCELAEEQLAARTRVLAVHPKPKVENIEDAEVIVVAGRGLRREKDLEMVYALAERLGGQVASTRPLIEAGWVDPRRQIGLSGRTVKPRLIVTCGVSGSIQFVSGMKGSETIVAINLDPQAPIFKTAHYCLVGDLYEILPHFLAQVPAGKTSPAVEVTRD